MTLPHIALRTYQTELDSHSHDHAQLVLPVKGILELEIGHNSGVINTETAAFITSGERHSFAGSEENLFIVVDIEQKQLTQASLPSFMALSPVTKQFLHFAHYYLINQSNDLFAHSLINDLLVNLLSQPLISNQDLLVLKAKKWMDVHFAESININRLTQHCHLSSSQLQRRFKKSTGYGLAEYWRHKRMLRAQFLLATSSLSVAVIAATVGYENVSAFSRSFSKSLEMHPSHWREMTVSAKKSLLLDNSSGM
jgi:AraC-like DNA-binding protein